MKLTSPRTIRKAAAFTLIEMIGVLAVIAILAAVLIPKVFEAINNSRINNAAMSCQTVKTAMADHYGKTGSFASEYDTIGQTNKPLALPQANYDQVLMREGFMDKPFATKIGNGATGATGTRAAGLNIGPNPGLAWALGTGVATDGSTGYALAGGGTNVVVGSACLQCVITGVTENDAKDLNDRIDGPTLGVPIGTAAGDKDGRVIYAAPSAGVTTVYVYLTHR